MNAGTIVVVEDNELNMRLMGDILKVAGFTMIGRPDGENVCDVVAEADPLVVLMDIQLPRWSGVELRGFLTADPRTRHVPVYAVTANCDVAALQSYADAGFAGVFKKPVKVRDLLAKLVELRTNQESKAVAS